MRIKKLELVGFKSFKDRTVIHFDAGITGIVGPNGCGKSNIVDALVWVMGEMSPKHLRGSSMEDVIFGGSEAYAPLGMAEVSLTLENDGGAFPAQYVRHSEIMVTRRLHRSGDSEYLINREVARLRDVQEIFMDTGAGSKGFSIIEQGQIGRIITAKPEDRRTLIEEAAGITKFKARKRESQRKLEATDQNLVRLQDIIGELKRQLGSLERQAQKAERYRKLKQEIEALELWVFSKQYVELRERVRTAQTEFDESQGLEIQAVAQHADVEARVQEIKAQLLSQEAQVKSLQTAHFAAKTQVQQKEVAIRELRFEIEQARRTSEMTGSLLSQNTARRDLLEQDQKQVHEKMESVQAQAAELKTKLDEQQSKFQAQQAKITECDEVLTRQRREMLTVSQGESHLDAKHTSLQDQHSEISERVTNAHGVLLELKDKLDEFTNRRNQVFARLEKERQMKLDIMRDVENFAANAEKLEGEIKVKEGEVALFKDDLNEVSSRLYGLENLHSNFEGFEDGVKNVMLWQKERANESRLQPMAEAIEVPAEYELAMEASLGNRLQMLLASGDSNAPLGAVDYLKQNQLGRSSFLSEKWVKPAAASEAASAKQNVLTEEGVKASLIDVIRVQPAHERTVATVLKDVIVVDSIMTALRLRDRYNEFSFVTVDGDTLTNDGVLTAGASGDVESGVLKRRREIKELSERKLEASGKLQLAQLALQKLQAQYETVKRDLNTAQQSQTEKEILLAELKKDFERAEHEHKNAMQAIERQEREISHINEQKLRLEDQVQEIEGRLTELREKRLSIESDISTYTEQLNEAKTGIDDLRVEVTQLQVQDASLRQELEGLTRQNQMLEKSLKEVCEQLNAMNQETDRHIQSLSSNQAKLEEEKVALDHLILEAERTEGAVSQASDEFEKTQAQCRELEEQLSQLTTQKNSLQSKINEVQLRLEQARMREENLTTQVREKYLQELSQIADSRAQNEGNMEEAEASLRDLKEKAGKIGDVNLSAIEEYDESKTRYEFLSQQQEDLLKAKDQLRKVIDRINRICTRRFKETFDLVNDRFTKVFPVLFGGGEALLTLIENPDKGEMGIDITAKPPGKKLQSVSLMSGGEKALTAVALIFSIFLVKPSPYCLLDEVDAPLDDANVSRFNDLVKEMARRSQIIVVTHNKYTMEVSEKLYGVTMQEKGVSKMVSVSLADAQKAV